MDPSYESSEDEDDAMAQMMGFSSFATKTLAKKRKFNPTTDAFVDGQELASLDRGGKKGQGSGGNQVPLGKMRILGSGAVANAEKSTPEDVDDAEEEYREEGEADTTSVFGNSNTATLQDEEDDGLQQRIDRILQENTPRAVSSQAVTGLPPPPLPSAIPPQLPIGQCAPGTNQQYAPRSMQSPALSFSSHASSVPTRERGQKNPNWHVGYYDPTFNENPWAELEKLNGLEAVGSWV